MAKTFLQMADQSVATAHAINVEDAIAKLGSDADGFLVDVRDAAEFQILGFGEQGSNAPGRLIAWLANADPGNEWREPELQDRNRRLITTCIMSPCCRGAKAECLLKKIGFSNV